MSSLIIVVVILFVAELVRSSIGFGNALVAMPLLVLVMDLRLATPLVALVSMTAAVVILGSSLRDVRFSDAWRLNLGALAGVPLGVLVLNKVPQQLGVGIIALLIIGYGGYSLMRPELLRLFLISLPGVLLATAIGRRVNHRVSYRSFRRVINLFLIAMGFFMLARLW